MKTPTVWAAGAVSLICLACAAAAAEKTPGTQEALRHLRELRRSVERIWTVGSAIEIRPVIRGYEKHMAGLTALDLRALAALRSNVHLTELEKKLAEIAIDRKIRPDLYQRVQAALEASYKRRETRQLHLRRILPLWPLEELSTAEYRLVWEEVLLRPCTIERCFSHRLTGQAAAGTLSTVGHPDSIKTFTMVYRLSLPRKGRDHIRAGCLRGIAGFAKGGDKAAKAAFAAAYECYSMTDPGEKARRLRDLEYYLSPAIVEPLIRDTQSEAQGRMDLLKAILRRHQKAKAEKAKASR